MNKIAILTDSASNINENIEQGIFVVPLYVNFKGSSKKDLCEISPEELYNKIDDEAPTTSSPSIDDFVQKIALIKSLGYDEIFGIAISAELSGTLNAMRLALDSANINHRIVDSKTVTMAEGLLAIYASDLVKHGKSLDQVYEIILNKLNEVKLFTVVSDLKYLIRGGRINHLKGLLGSLLKMNPILTTDEDGRIKSYKSFRGKSKALKYMVNTVNENLNSKKDYYIAIAYAQEVNEVSKLKDGLEDVIDNAILFVEGPMTSVLGAQAGPSVYIVSYLEI